MCKNEARQTKPTERQTRNLINFVDAAHCAVNTLNRSVQATLHQTSHARSGTVAVTCEASFSAPNGPRFFQYLRLPPDKHQSEIDTQSSCDAEKRTLSPEGTQQAHRRFPSSPAFSTEVATPKPLCLHDHSLPPPRFCLHGQLLLREYT